MSFNSIRLLYASPSAFAMNQFIEAPLASTSCGHVKENETEQNRGLALVLNRPCGIGCVKLPIGNRHLAGKNKCDRTGQETEHDGNTTSNFEQSTNSYLRHQRLCTAAGHSASTIAHARIAACASLRLVTSFLAANMIRHPTSQPITDPTVVPMNRWAATCNQVLPSEPKLNSGAL